MVLSRKHWRLPTWTSEQLTPELIQAAGSSSLLAKLLLARGVSTPEAATAFLAPEAIVPAPPDVFEDMPKAVERVLEAIDAQEMILIYGDFDVDGITGTSILLEGLNTLGAKVSYYLPSRHDEGHGLNTAALLRLISTRQVKVVITTDNGTGNFNEVNVLKGLGVDTIITDHHEYPENLPFAHAILNPLAFSKEHPCRFFSGAGMAFQLMRGLYAQLGKPESELDSLLDLMAIGTIVDMVPLKGDNRYWVRKGLAQLNKRQRVGLNALLSQASVDVDTELTTTTIGFTLGPRLNAVGRITRADEGVELLLTQDATKAQALAAQLDQYNRQRQEWVDATEREARQQIEGSGMAHGQKAIIVAAPHWNLGIVGLVATRLVDAYSRPAFVGVIDEEKGLVRFSGRSIPSVHLTELMTPFTERFEHWGGHAAAAGFSAKLDGFSRLKFDLLKAFDDVVTESSMMPILDVDLLVEPEQLTLGMLELMQAMMPFGQANPEPLFMLENVRLGAQRFLGEAKRHVKFMWKPSQGASNQFLIESVYWGWQGELLDDREHYDLVFKVGQNTYQGVTKLQLTVEDIRLHGHTKPLKPSQELPMANSEGKPLSVSEPAPVLTRPLLPFELADLRETTSIDSLLLEWMQDSRVAIFTEGTQSQLPLPCPEAALFSRETTWGDKGVNHLVLWDYPVEMASFARQLRGLSLDRLTIIGGKYRTAPLVDSP